jgi:pyruvate dehydrogenase complex dehydrogenase (E1) component
MQNKDGSAITDQNTEETKEWLDSLDSVIREGGSKGAR